MRNGLVARASLRLCYPGKGRPAGNRKGVSDLIELKWFVCSISKRTVTKRGYKSFRCGCEDIVSTDRSRNFAPLGNAAELDYPFVRLGEHAGGARE